MDIACLSVLMVDLALHLPFVDVRSPKKTLRIGFYNLKLYKNPFYSHRE